MKPKYRGYFRYLKNKKGYEPKEAWDLAQEKQREDEGGLFID